MEEESKQPFVMAAVQFDVPSPESAANKWDIDNVDVGDFAKICFAEEPMWAKVTKIDGEKIKGTIDRTSDYVELNGLKNGDEIEFERKHIFKIIKK